MDKVAVSVPSKLRTPQGADTETTLTVSPGLIKIHNSFLGITLLLTICPNARISNIPCP